MAVHRALIGLAQPLGQGVGQSGLLQAAVDVQGIEQVLQMAADGIHAAPLLGGGLVVP